MLMYNNLIITLYGEYFINYTISRVSSHHVVANTLGVCPIRGMHCVFIDRYHGCVCPVLLSNDWLSSPTHLISKLSECLVYYACTKY